MAAERTRDGSPPGAQVPGRQGLRGRAPPVPHWPLQAPRSPLSSRMLPREGPAPANQRALEQREILTTLTENLATLYQGISLGRQAPQVGEQNEPKGHRRGWEKPQMGRGRTPEQISDRDMLPTPEPASSCSSPSGSGTTDTGIHC